MTGRAVIVDGASGFAGSSFAHLLLREGATVVALHRGDPARTWASIRDAEVGDHFATPLDPAGLELHPYDLLAPGLGVGDLARRLDPGLPWEHWHFAADLRFMAGDAAALRRVNVDGTRNALEWFAAGVPDRPFVHISTVYSCGAARGVCTETWHPRPDRFRNRYEESKWEAEAVVRQHLAGAPGGVVRLPGLLGSSLTGRNRSRSGVYGLIERLARLSRSMPGETIRVPVAPGAGEVLLPVDVSARWMVDLPVERLGRLDPPIVQLVPEGPTPVAAFLAAIEDCLPLSVVATPPGVPIDDPTDVEAVVHAGLGFLDGYMRGPATRFDRTHLRTLGAFDAPPLDEAAASMMVRAFVTHLQDLRARGVRPGRGADADGSALTLLPGPVPATGPDPITDRGGTPCLR